MTEANAGGYDLGVLAEVLDRPLESIADMPTFETPPLGRYKLHVSGEVKTLAEKPAIAMQYTILEVKELKDEEDRAFFEGKKGEQKFSQAFLISAEAEKTEYSLQAMKAQFGAVGTAMGIVGLKQLMETVCAGLIIEATMKHRKDKKDPTVFYPSLSEVVLAS